MDLNTKPYLSYFPTLCVNLPFIQIKLLLIYIYIFVLRYGGSQVHTTFPVNVVPGFVCVLIYTYIFLKIYIIFFYIEGVKISKILVLTSPRCCT